MPRPVSATLTDGEVRLMNVLWDRGPSTVVEIQDALPDDLVDSTIRTLLGILVDKGYVRREKDGRAFRYRPAVERDASRANVVASVVQRFFGRPAELVLNMIDSNDLDARELAEIRRALDRRRKRSR